MAAKFLAAFERFRSGPGFIIALTVILIVYCGINYIHHFDKEAGFLDLPAMNFMLSVEAAYAVPLLMMAKRRQELEAQRQVKLLADMIESQLALLEEISGKKRTKKTH
jgi:uncharacterized membrane protein